MKMLMLLVLVTLSSCSSVKDSPKQVLNQSTLAQESLLGTNWYQTSGEARALYLQGYELARIRFNEALKVKGDKPKAVVVDIDETILDNSPYQAKIIQEKVAYPSYWAEWISSESARALPGALSFLKYVKRNGGTVFYITNRKEHEKEHTLNNLKKLGFPVTPSQLLLRVDKSDKTERRNSVAKKYDIVLFIGDNLNDFDGVFENTSVLDRNALVGTKQKDFNKKYIILPNPIYGDWESAIYDYNYRHSDAKKHELRMKALRSF